MNGHLNSQEMTARLQLLRPVEVAVSFASVRSTSLTSSALQRYVHAAGFGLDSDSDPPNEMGVTRVHFGSDFCDRLQPSPRQLQRAITVMRRHSLTLTLTTGILSDSKLTELRALLSLLDPASEVVANDWGTLRLLHTAFPKLVPIAGRLLCKMVKDPRLPSRQWTTLYPHGVHSISFCAALERLGVKRIEMDAPPFAAASEFQSPAMAVSIHVPYGFAAKGRMCWFGSLSEPDKEQFTVTPTCQRECLRYRAERSRPHGSATDLATVQRGNTLMYRHSIAMAEAVSAAVRAGVVDRLIVSGDWH